MLLNLSYNMKRLSRRLFTTLVEYSEPYGMKFIAYEFKNVIVETQPPYCEVCKQYLTEFSCNNIRATNCPYFDIEQETTTKKPNKNK